MKRDAQLKLLLTFIFFTFGAFFFALGIQKYQVIVSPRAEFDGTACNDNVGDTLNSSGSTSFTITCIGNKNRPYNYVLMWCPTQKKGDKTFCQDQVVERDSGSVIPSAINKSTDKTCGCVQWDIGVFDANNNEGVAGGALLCAENSCAQPTPTTPPPTISPTTPPTVSPTTRPTVPPSSTPTVRPTNTPTTPPGQPTNTPAPTHTPTAVPTSTPKPTATNTPVPTNTPTPSATPTNTPTSSPTRTPTPTPTKTPTLTPTLTYTPTAVPTSTLAPTATSTPVPTATNTIAPTATNTPSPTATTIIAATNTPTTVQQLTVEGKPPGLTPWLIILAPLGLILLGLLL